MSKVTKYPKYKQEAYSRLDKMFKGILKESGFYTQHPELESEGLVFSHDPSENIKGEITVSVRGTNLLKLHGKEIIYFIPRGIRLSLTSEERQVVVETVNIFFSIGKYSNVTKYIGDLHSWCVSSEICRFCGVCGETYINSKSYSPPIIAQFPKKG